MISKDRLPQILSVKEFRSEFDIPEGGLSIGKYENGNYGWQAKLESNDVLRGPVSQQLLAKGNDSECAFVKYFWGKEGEPLKDPVWVFQIRPSVSQVRRTFALCILLESLNSKKEILFGEKWRPFTLSELKYHLEQCKKDSSYIDFSIPKRNGKLRSISAPNHELKAIQNCLNLILQEKYHPTSAAMGFVHGRSVADNARVHQGQNYVYNIDIKDFFPSISKGRVFAVLQNAPYSFDKYTASIVADLSCHKGVLPQGAPTSPILTNIICERLDWRLSKLARGFNLKYSRYADDITFSGMENMFHSDGAFLERLQHYVEKEGFRINPEKTRLNTIAGRQEVTGLTVNEKPNVSKQYVKNLRTMIYNWEKLGREEAQARMASSYQKAGKISVKGIPQIENVIQGKLNYLKMIKGSGDSSYAKLNSRYRDLYNQYYGLQIILELWEKKGFAAAAKEYVNRYPWEKEYDTGSWTLSEFENMIGKKVRFSSLSKANIATSPKARNTMLQFGEDIPVDWGSAADNGKHLISALVKMGVPEYYSPSIDWQTSWGKVHLVCDCPLDLQKDVFVCYGDYKGKKCFMFSNTKGHLINGEIFDDAQINDKVSGIKDGNVPSDMVLKMIMNHKCESPKCRELRTKLLLKEIDSEIDKKESDIAQWKSAYYEVISGGGRKGNGNKTTNHDPRFTADFLSLFNQRDGFKYLTHNYDQGNCVLTDMLDHVRSVFNQYSASDDLPVSLKSLMNHFLNGGTWYDQEGRKCAEGYSSRKWIDWSERNENMHPIMNIGGIEKTIQRFRHTIRVVAPDLQTIVGAVSKKFPNIHFEFVDLGKADFYTNVYILRLAILDIIKDISEHGVNKPVRIEYKPDFNKEYFIRKVVITQQGSYSPISIEEAIAKFKVNGGFFAENAIKLTGYCDWSVESIWNGSPYRWNILRDKETPEIEEIEPSSVTGFSHVLTFYYKA